MAINKLFKNHSVNGIDAFYITSAVNRKYFTGFTSSAGYLILTKNRKVFITDYRYFEDAKQVIHGSQIEVLAFAAREELPAMLIEALGDSKTVGFEDNRLSYADYLGLKERMSGFELVAAGEIIDSVRQVKTEKEIHNIMEAQAVNDKVFAKMCNFFHSGYTEHDCAVELDYQIRKLGGEGNAFETIMAFGENTSKPHSIPGKRKLESGDLILMDYGTKFKGYCSDISRTMCFGKPIQQFSEIYNIVLQAQKQALANIKAGISCREIDAVAREYIKANNYEKNFNHNLGHSVGLEIHEKPNFTIKSEEILVAGNILTVEPGIYVEGVGGVRIEDLVVVTEDGIKNLTRAAKDKLIVL